METTSSVGKAEEDFDTATCGVPQLKTLTELQHTDVMYFGRRNDIIDYTNEHPDTEHIYVFKVGDHMDLFEPGDHNPPNNSSWLKNCAQAVYYDSIHPQETGCIVAGSYALWVLDIMLKRDSSPIWKPGDVDLFILDKPRNGRHAPSGGLLDIVHTTDKTPQEVISNFDLPCCRVAFDMNYTFYVSIHALTAIFSKKVHLPSYLRSSPGFSQKLNQYRREIPTDIPESSIKDYHIKLIRRMEERIRKYQSRGFSFVWYDTEYVLPWIKTRFSYVDFERPNSPEITKKVPLLSDYLNSRTKRHDLQICIRLIQRHPLENAPDLFAAIRNEYPNDEDLMVKLNILEAVLSLYKQDPDKYRKAWYVHTNELDKALWARIVV